MKKPMSDAQKAALAKAQKASAEKRAERTRKAGVDAAVQKVINASSPRSRPTTLPDLDIHDGSEIATEGAGPPQTPTPQVQAPWSPHGRTAAAPKPMRRSSKDPKTTPPAEVPDWARRAERTNTPAEMAGVAPVEPTVANDRPSLAEVAKATARKPRAPKAPKPVRAFGTHTAPAAAGSLRAVGDGWLAAIAADGHTPATVKSYGMDLWLAYEFFGDATATEASAKLALFNESKICLEKKNGKPKAKPTIDKTRRALRMALEWAATVAS